MAGMLPGVECARRRRFYGSGPSTEPAAGVAAHSWTRRPSFCLYISNNESHNSSMSFSRNKTKQANYEDDGKLGGAAREAKERLDERLRSQKKSDSSRSQNSKEKLIVVQGELPTEVFGSKKAAGSGSGGGGSRRLISWFGSKGTGQVDCAICLDRFRTGETLVHLTCSHRFHSRCLVPWLEKNVHCPCCRMEIWELKM